MTWSRRAATPTARPAEADGVVIAPHSLRRIAVVSTSRADYGHLYWPLRALAARPEIDLRLIVTAAHLDDRYGRTLDQIRAEGFQVHATVPCLEPGDADTDMARTIGRAVLGFTDVLDRLRPDILLLIADRYELLAPASVALTLRIPIAHIEGGDVSEGAIDDAVRNALTKLAHIHFTPTHTAKRRVIAMGEEPWRVHQTGAPSLDHLHKSTLPSRLELEQLLCVTLEPDVIVIAYHPLTLARDTLCEADAFYSALERLPQQMVFCFPNADAGSQQLIERSQEFCVRHSNARLYVNLPHLAFWSLLREAGMMLGNSSSGIMETPALALPTVNVGQRQAGRERALNIIDAPADAGAIVDAACRALSPDFKANLLRQGVINPYGDGHAAERIAKVLSDLPAAATLLHKRALPLSGSGLAENDEFVNL